MELSNNTKSFLNEFVFPHFIDKEVNNGNVYPIIDYIVDTYETPISKSIAEGEEVDFDMFQRAYLDGVGFERVDVLVSKSSAEGISKNPRNREAVIEQDLSIMKANRIMWYKYPLEPYFRYQRMRELSEIKRKNT